MKKLLILAILGTFIYVEANAGFFTWRYREHATDCTSLTDGKNTDLCFEQDDDTVYKCDPTSGDCDTAGEWKQIGVGISNVVEDTTPQAGGDMDFQSAYDINNLVNLELEGYAIFAPLASQSYQRGLLYYSDNNETLEFFNDESEVEHQIGQELWVRVYNDSGATITNGSVVYSSGTTQEGTTNRPTIALAQADDPATSKVLGIATHDIEDLSYGFVTHFGLINDLNTASFSDGDLIYLSATSAGAFTASEPESPNLKIFLGEVVKSDASAGTVLLSVIGNTGNESGDATQLVLPARKGSAGTITKGQLVYISGYNTGQSQIEIELADADGSGTYPAIGVANGTITNSVSGDIVFSGRVVNVNTGSFSVGDTVYLSTTAGAYSTTKPTGDNDCVQGVGRVARANSSVGVIQVSGAGRCNDIPNSATPTGAWDFGGATSLEVPNSATCSSTTEGVICWDSDDDTLYVGDGTTASAIGGGGGTTDAGTWVEPNDDGDSYRVYDSSGTYYADLIHDGTRQLQMSVTTNSSDSIGFEIGTLAANANFSIAWLDVSGTDDGMLMVGEAENTTWGGWYWDTSADDLCVNTKVGGTDVKSMCWDGQHATYNPNHDGSDFKVDANSGGTLIDVDTSANTAYLGNRTNAMTVGVAGAVAFTGTGNFTLPQAATCSNTAEGSVCWDTDDDDLCIGDGTSTLCLTFD